MKKNRILALLLAVVLVVGLLPMAAMAADPKVIITVKADKTSVDQDGEVNYTVNVKSTINLTAVQVFLDVPAGMQYVANSGALLVTKADLGADDASWVEASQQIFLAGTDPLKGLAAGLDVATFKCKAVKAGSPAVNTTKGDNGTVFTDTFEEVEGDDLSLVAASVTVNKTSYTASEIQLAYADTLAIQDASFNGTAAPTFKVIDKDDATNPVEWPAAELTKATWTVDKTWAQVSDAGVVSIKDIAAAEAGNITVTVSIGGETKTATVTVTKPAATVTTVEVSGPATAIIPAADTDPANEYEYTATVKDQYGATMTGQTITWATDPASVTGVSIDTDGKLSVAAGATAGAIKVKATVGSVDGDADVTVTKIAFTLATGAVKAVDGTYGDTYGDLVTIDASKITAKVGTTTVTGTYSILEGEDNYPDAAATVAYTVVFNNDTYTDIEVDAGTVKVEKAPLKIEAQDVGVRVGTADADMPADSEYYTVTGLVAGDELSDVLTVTVTKPTISTAEAGKEYDITVAYTEAAGAANYTITGAASQTAKLSITKKKVLAPLPSTPAGPGTTDPGTTTPTTPRFTDVSADDWFNDAVNFVAEKGLMTGTTETTFAPSMNTSRAMIATILWRHAGSPAPRARIADFPDVEEGWYLDAVRWCAENEIVTGFEDGTFRPNDNITREQMVVMMRRYAEKAGLPTTATADLSTFADGESVGTWAAEAVQWAVGAGLIQGKGANDLDPQGLATRAEVATILMRFVNLK